MKEAIFYSLFFFSSFEVNAYSGSDYIILMNVKEIVCAMFGVPLSSFLFSSHPAHLSTALRHHARDFLH